MPTWRARRARSLSSSWMRASTSSIFERSCSIGAGGADRRRRLLRVRLAAFSSCASPSSALVALPGLRAVISPARPARPRSPGSCRSRAASTAPSVSMSVYAYSPRDLLSSSAMFSEAPASSGGDLAHHVRHVAVGDADARGLGRARQHHFGEVHAVLDVAVLEVVLDGVGDHDGAVVLGLVGGGAEMRQGHDLRVILGGIGREVADVALQAAVIERMR